MSGEETETPKCPKCGAEMRLRDSYRGKFYGCSKFPECRGTRDYSGPQKTCPACGAPMGLKNGKNGRFYSCTKYPECRTTEDYVETCPKCGSEMVEREGANGKFLGCKKYPECKGTRNIGPRKENSSKSSDIEDTTDYGSSEDSPF